MIRRSGIKCCLSECRHRIKRQSQITIILLANNIVAIIHLFKDNKFIISTFLLEPLTKKDRSVSFVSQFILPNFSEHIGVGEHFNQYFKESWKKVIVNGNIIRCINWLLKNKDLYNLQRHKMTMGR